MTLEELTANLRPEARRLARLGALKIDFGQDGVIVMRDGDIGNVDGAAECTVKVGKSIFEQILRGDLSAEAAFTRGAVRLEGDREIALEFQHVLLSRPA